MAQMFEPKYEKMSRGKLENLQKKLLRKIVRYCYSKIPLYKKKFKLSGLNPNNIRGLEDLEKIPFTTKEDLRKSYPYGLFAVSLDKILELHTSSGTTGTPTTCAYTKNDLDVWSNVMARVCASAGVRKGDLVQNAYGYGLFTGGLGFHYGALKLGATVLPIAAGGTERQLRLARELGTTVLACTPSYAAYLCEYAKKMGINPKKDLKWRIGLFGAEPWSEELRQRLEKTLGIEAFDIYGLSEIIGPGVSVECHEHSGLHLYEDHFLPEIIDPETGEHLEEGKKGELVLTTLTREAMPLLRFRTGDITAFTKERCKCGRTIGRISRIFGRSDDMLKVRGVKFWPKTAEDALLRVPGASENYQIIIERPAELDVMTIKIEPEKEISVAKAELLKKEIANSIKSVIGLSAKVIIVSPGSLPRFAGKAKRILDKRE